MGGQLASGQGGLLDGYLNSRDMFDGGGPGKSGDKFEGGGLLSLIANMFGKPLPPLKGAGATATTATPRVAGAPAVTSRSYDEPRQDYTVRRGMNAPAEYVPTAYDYAQSVEARPGVVARPLPGSDIRSFTSGMATYTAKNPARPFVGPALRDVLGLPPKPQQPQQALSYGPATRPVVNPQPDAPPVVPRPQAVSLVDEFEAYLATRPNAAVLMNQFNDNPAAATKLMQHWLMNGKQLPGM